MPAFLEPVKNIENLPEFDNHKLVSFIFDARTGLHGFIAIHRGGLSNPALGATRFWSYESESEALNDALRLSKMMSYKSALAGLKYGGAKAVIMNSPSVKSREELFRAYAQKINYLSGRFVTGADVGVTDEDLKTMRKETTYVIGLNVDAAYFTAVGVIYGIQTALKVVFGREKIAGRSFAIQGLGKTGFHILDLLYRETSKIVASDVDAIQARSAKKRFPKIKIVPSSQIHREEADVFVPCALSGVLNSKSVAELRSKIVAGSANNQLAGEHIGALLHQLGALYVPDYVINAGGLLSVVEELEHETPSEKRIMAKIERIKKTLRIIFDKSKKQNRPTSLIANEMAEKIFNNHA